MSRVSAAVACPSLVAQAAARDVAMYGLLRLVDAELLPRLRLFLHDEVVLSVPAGDAVAYEELIASLLSFDWETFDGLVMPIVAKPADSHGTPLVGPVSELVTGNAREASRGAAGSSGQRPPPR